MLEKHQIVYELIYHADPIHTVNEAKKYFNVHQAVPVLIVKTERGFYSLLVSGARGHVDLEVIKKVLGCKEVCMASKQEVLQKTGYEIGKIPLIGHGLPCIFDTRLSEHPHVYGGTADKNYTLKIDPSDLTKLNNIIATID